MKMRAYLIIAVLALTFAEVAAFAQAGGGVKVDPYIGLAVPVRNIGGSDVKETAGLNLGVEIRKYLPESPLSVGVDIFCSTAARKRTDPDGDSHNSQRMAGIAAVVDYNTQRHGPASFFAGAGVGLVQRNTIRSGIDNGIGICPTYAPVVSPRVGVELWNHLRLTAEARITQRDYNVLAFRIGYSFGKSKR